MIFKPKKTATHVLSQEASHSRCSRILMLPTSTFASSLITTSTHNPSRVSPHAYEVFSVNPHHPVDEHLISRSQDILSAAPSRFLPGNRFPKNSICHDDSGLWKADVGDSSSPEHLQVATSSLLPGIMDVLVLFHLMLTHYPARSF